MCTVRSSKQLWDEENEPFFGKWRNFCAESISVPTRDLLDALWSVDLTTTLVVPGYYQNWEAIYTDLVPWVRKYVSSV